MNNEIETETSTPTIAAIEQCQKVAANRFMPKPLVRDKWRQDYTVPESYFRDTEFKPPEKYNIGDTIASIEAVQSPELSTDLRPRFFDNVTKAWTLLDSGSCVSCVPKDPNDKIDPAFKLRAVNGQSIPTFGTKVISIRIGRKQYEIEAIKTDINQQILGWDLFAKYKLGFEWNEDELYLTDKKAQIRSLLKFIKVDSKQIKRIECVDYYEEPVFENISPQTLQFQFECMKSVDETTCAEKTFAESQVANQVDAMTIHPDHPSPIAEDIPLGNEDPDVNASYEMNLKALDKLQEPYKSLVAKYAILKADFKKEPAKDIYHRIETTGAPFKSKVRPLLASSEKSKLGKKTWEEMERLGVIERVKQDTTLQYTSPIHLVRKPSGIGWRVCADFRLLNSQTKADNYPLPLLRSFQHNIKGSKVFSKLDLQSAFHHLPIHPDDVNKTCVVSPWGGAFVYKRLAFGLTNGPSSWQKYVDGALSGIEDTFCYLDDILVCSANVEQHMSTLTKIFQRLEQYGLTLSLDKCTFAQSTVDYLGYEVSGTGIRPLKRKTEAITRIPAPTTQKQLLQFLGALNYFRSSLSGIRRNGKYSNAANLLQPLYSAATVPVPPGKFQEIWQNSPCLQQAFVDAKELLIQAAELAHPDPSLPLALMTDASQHSIGACLMQRSLNGKWTPLGYMSKHLSVDKVKWSTCRKELLAAQAGLRYFITEIYGRHCTIWSDHAPLVLAFKNPNGFQLHDPVAQRALVEIGQFTKDVRHVAGLQNVGSDFLSRVPIGIKGTAFVTEEPPSLTDESATISAIEGHKLVSISPLVVYEAQQDCQETLSIKNGKHPTSASFGPVTFGDCELLCELSSSKPRPVLPKSLRRHVIQQIHNLAHKRVKESVRLVAANYYWQNLKCDVTEYVQTCHACQSVQPSKQKLPQMGTFEEPDERFSHCHVDIVGPLPITAEGYRFLLTCIDRSTKLLLALPLKEATSQACADNFMLHYVSLFGLPSLCTSDHGSSFTSGLWKDMQTNLGIEVKHSPIYWPQTNGLIERNHQTLKNSIKASLIQMGDKYQGNWIKYLPWALLGQRTAFNRTLGTSSAFMSFGFHPQVPGTILQEPTLAEDSEATLENVLSKLQFINDRVALPTSAEPLKEFKEPPKNLTHIYAKQHDTKGFDSRYRGPFRVKSRPTRTTVEIKVGENRDRSEIRHFGDVKPAYLRDDAVEAERPRRGRPPKAEVPLKDTTSPQPQSSTETSLQLPDQNNENSNVGGNTRPARSTRNPAPNYVDSVLTTVDFSTPPPGYPEVGNSKISSTTADPTSRTWSATPEDLADINRSIRGV